jgi:hypothetical protein
MFLREVEVDILAPDVLRDLSPIEVEFVVPVPWRTIRKKKQ